VWHLKKPASPAGFFLAIPAFIKPSERDLRCLLQRADVVHRLVEMNMAIDMIDPA
jgi:hypothetical protein